MGWPEKRHIALKASAQFYETGKPCVNGHIAPRYTIGRACTACTKAYHQTSRGRTSSERWFKELPYQEKLIAWARHRCKYRGVEFAITAGDISWPTHCPALGVELIYSSQKNKTEEYWRTVTIDRVDNSKGYIPGNVFAISRRANTIKAAYSLEQISGVAEYIRSALSNDGKRELRGVSKEHERHEI